MTAYPAMAGLEWETQRINHTALVTDDKAEIAFTFTNTGEQPVTIESIRTSCGCTTTKLDKQAYAPGESGEITTVFAFGDRVGTQHKRITVRTSTPTPDSSDSASPDAVKANPGAKPIVEDTALYLKVTIPEPVKLRPRIVYWKCGEAATPKTVRITIDHDSPVSLTQAGIEGGIVAAELRTVEKGKVYELVITPCAPDTNADTPDSAEASMSGGDDAGDKPAVVDSRSIVSLKADFGDDQTRTYTVLARVMPNPAEVSASISQESSTKTTDAMSPLQAKQLRRPAIAVSDRP